MIRLVTTDTCMSCPITVYLLRGVKYLAKYASDKKVSPLSQSDLGLVLEKRVSYIKQH
jgi:hypothetical protein